MSTFSDRLKSSRIAAKLRQQDLANEAGVSLRVYQYYEKGEQQPTFSKLLALADALNVSLDYLAGRTDKPEVNK